MAIVIGRENDLARVREAFARSNVCALVGPGGVGKSTLAGALVAPLAERAVFVDAHNDDQPVVVLTRLAETLDVDHVVDPAGDDLERVTAILAVRLAAADVAMVVVDDVEQHSDATFPMLADLAARAPAVSILITSRTQPVLPSVQIVRLAPLDIATGPDETEPTAMMLFRHAFVQAGGDADMLDAERDAAEQLVVATGGLPLALTVEAARAAMIGARNALGEDAPAGSSLGTLTDDDPVGAVLGRSLRHLDSTTLDVFETIGAFRSDASMDDIALVSGIELPAVSGAVGRLARRSLVAVDRGRVSILPPLRRVARRHAEHRGRRASLERGLSEWAVATCRVTPPLSTSRITAVEEDLVWAVDVALGEQRLDDAATIATVLDDAFRSDLRHGRRLDVLEPILAARSGMMNDRIDDTGTVDATIETMRVTVAARADALGWSSAGALLDRAEALVDGSSEPSRHAARIESLRAALAFDSGDLRTARHCAMVGIEAGGASADAVGMYTSIKLLADVELDSGNVGESVRLAHDVVTLAPPEHRWLRSYAMSTIAMSELERGATSRVLAVARRLEAEAIDGGDVDLEVEADWLAAMADPSRESSTRRDLTGERAGHSVLHIQADIARAIRRLAAGDAAAAIAIAADCELRACFRPMRALAIDAQLLVGDAAILLHESAEAARAHTQALEDAVAHGYRLRVPDALDGLADVIALSAADTSRQNACRFAAAEIRSHLGLVARPRPWGTASPSAHARPPAGWVDGGTLTAAGLRGALEAVAATGRGHPATANSSDLSPAELVVANLVADGCNNREIGERLYISRRTVESHIAHAFQKLNVRSRTQLAAIVLEERRR